MAGGQLRLRVRVSGCLLRVSSASPSCGICHPPQGLWWQQLGKAAEHLARPVQLLCGALPRNAFGTQQWIKLSFIPTPGCPSCSQKPPQGYLCCPVAFIPQNMSGSCVWISSSSCLC